MIHKLKTWPVYFNLVKQGIKTFEIRENDRNFQVGDILILQEFLLDRQVYTGREISVKVSNVHYKLPSARKPNCDGN